jgi:hypothetical protein
MSEEKQDNTHPENEYTEALALLKKFQASTDNNLLIEAFDDLGSKIFNDGIECEEIDPETYDEPDSE